jgi:hypothetical protein
VKIRHYANPSRELCVVLQAESGGMATVDFHSINGEKAGSKQVYVQIGLNQVCLDQVVASGIYFGSAKMEGLSEISRIKLAIRR